jgi:hypothetical protein
MAVITKTGNSIRINLQKEKIHRRTGDVLKNSSCMCSLNLNWGLKIK